MRRFCPSTILACMALVPAFAQVPAPAPPATTVETLGWMAGAWVGRGRLDIEEHWMSPKAGAMVGMSRTVAKGRMVSFEFLRIETREGQITYVASPGGQPPTRFVLVRASSSEAVFENPAHDFPKRIIYRLETDGGLLARIEGDGTEREKPMDFRYARMKP